MPESEAAGWTGIGPLGLSRLKRDGSQVGRIDEDEDGQVAWTFGHRGGVRPGHATNTGWNFDEFDDESVLAGSVGLRETGAGYRTTWDLTAFRTGAMAADTGNLLWAPTRPRCSATSTSPASRGRAEGWGPAIWVLDDEHVALGGEDGRVVIDVETGRTRDLTGSDVP